MKENVCPVCGYDKLREPPRSKKTKSGSYEICPSCSFQFGVSDDDEGWTYSRWREKWIKEGLVWDKGSSKPPLNWDPTKQLKNIDVDIEQ